jgi:Cu/Ag efflux protein CusF
MKGWKVVLAVDLALLLGVGFGYLWWGREVARVRAELRAEQARPKATAGEWTARGVVRGILPEMELIVLTHDEIADFMPAMTMGFRVASPRILDELAIGDEIEFTLKGIPPSVAITAVEKLP